MNVFTLNFDLIAHLERQRDWSERTFGPGVRTEGVCDHIRKELTEIAAKPHDLSEWIDVVLLALDGAWRAGYTPTEICEGLAAKQRKNEARKWPDWRTAEPGKAIEHDRRHERRIVGHASGWKEQMDTCICGARWPCSGASPETCGVPLHDERCCKLPAGHAGNHNSDEL